MTGKRATAQQRQGRRRVANVPPEEPLPANPSQVRNSETHANDSVLNVPSGSVNTNEGPAAGNAIKASTTVGDKVDLDEHNHYQGRSLRLVALEQNCRIPRWWYNTIEEVELTTHPIEWRILGEEHADENAALYGVFIADADYRNLKFEAAYLGFPNTNAFECFTQTDAAESFEQAFVYFHQRVQVEKNEAESGWSRFFAPPTHMVFATIQRLGQSAMASVLQRIRDPGEKLPLTMPDVDNTKIWTLVAVLLRLLDNNPHVFRETNEANSPPGSRFVAGHSMEDFSRALAVWVAFQASRCRGPERGNMYALRGQATKRLEYKLVMWQTKTAARERRRIEGYQDPLMAVFGKVDRHPIHMHLPAAANAWAAEYMARAVKSQIPADEWNTKEESSDSNWAYHFLHRCVQDDHCNMVPLLFEAFSPCKVHTGTLDPRPAMDAEAREQLRKHAYRQAIQTTVIEDMVEADPDQSRPADAVDQFTAVKTAVDSIPEKRLTVRFRILRMPQKIRREHAAMALSVRGQHKEFGGLAQAWSMDHNMTRLHAMSRHDAALVLLRHDCLEALMMREPLWGATDAGASWVFAKTVLDSTVPVPLSRLRMVQYLIAEAPALGYAISVALSTIAASAPLLIAVEDITSYRMLTMVLDTIGLAFVELPLQPGPELEDIRMAHAKGDTNIYVCHGNLPAYAEIFTTLIEYAVYIGTPRSPADLARIVRWIYKAEQASNAHWHIVTTVGTANDDAMKTLANSLLQLAPKGLYEQLAWFENMRRNWSMPYNIWPMAVLEFPVGSGHLNEWAVMGMGISHLVQLATREPDMQNVIDKASIGGVLGAALIFGARGPGDQEFAGPEGDEATLRKEVVRHAMSKLETSPVIAKQVEMHLTSNFSPTTAREATEKALYQELDRWVIGKKLFIPAFDDATLTHLWTSVVPGGEPEINRIRDGADYPTIELPEPRELDPVS